MKVSIFIVQAIGIILSISMSLVVVNAVWGIFSRAAHAAAPTTIASPPNAKSSDSSAASAAAAALTASPLTAESNHTDPNAEIANVMAAVSAAITAVALIFSVGVVWLGSYLEKLSKLRAEVTDSLAESKNLVSSLDGKLEVVQSKFRHQTESFVESIRSTVASSSAEEAKRFAEYEERIFELFRVDAARIQLLDAKVGLLQWVSKRCGSSDKYALHAMLVVQLEQMISSSQEARYEAFGRLHCYLVPEDMAELPAVSRFLDTCHGLHGGNAETVRKWCKVFSLPERAAYLEDFNARLVEFS